MRHPLGFTLFEFLITIFFVAIIAAWTVPNFSHFIQRQQIAGVSQQLVSALEFARSEAIKRAEVVTVCRRGLAAAGGSDLDCALAENMVDPQCHCAVDKSTDWGQGGWLVSSSNEHAEVLAVYPGLSMSGQMQLVGNAGVADKVAFNSLGYTHGRSGSWFACHRFNSSYSRKISVSLVGRIKVQATEVCS